MNELELSVQRLNTEAFIQADPLSIVLQRPERVEQPSGGHTWAPGVPVEEQVFRLIAQSDATPMVFTVDGVKLPVSLVLLCKFDANIQRYDKFTVAGIDYQVVGPIRPERPVELRYETKADVARL